MFLEWESKQKLLLEKLPPINNHDLEDLIFYDTGNSKRIATDTYTIRLNDFYEEYPQK